MEFIKSVVSGFAFGVGVCGAIALLSTLLRAGSSKEKAETRDSLLRLEVLHTAKLVELRRIADVLEFWRSREEKKAFHGE